MQMVCRCVSGVWVVVHVVYVVGGVHVVHAVYVVVVHVVYVVCGSGGMRWWCMLCMC